MKLQQQKHQLTIRKRVRNWFVFFSRMFHWFHSVISIHNNHFMTFLIFHLYSIYLLSYRKFIGHKKAHGKWKYYNTKAIYNKVYYIKFNNITHFLSCIFFSLVTRFMDDWLQFAFSYHWKKKNFRKKIIFDICIVCVLFSIRRFSFKGKYRKFVVFLLVLKYFELSRYLILPARFRQFFFFKKLDESPSNDAI